MEKIWERFAKVFGHKHVIDDGPIYPKPYIACGVI
jgi:hypothetical protein